MYSWERLKTFVEKVETGKLEDKYTDPEEGGRIRIRSRFGFYFELVGALIVGINAAILSVIFNFILFVSVLHMMW